MPFEFETQFNRIMNTEIPINKIIIRTEYILTSVDKMKILEYFEMLLTLHWKQMLETNVYIYTAITIIISLALTAVDSCKRSV